MKISEKKEDYKIYIEDEEKNYLSSGYIGEAENTIDKIVSFHFSIKGKRNEPARFSLNLTRQELAVFSKLINEANKYLNETNNN